MLDPTPLARRLVRKKVVVNYPDGCFAVQFEGMPFGFKLFDKIQTCNSARARRKCDRGNLSGQRAAGCGGRRRRAAAHRSQPTTARHNVVGLLGLP